METGAGTSTRQRRGHPHAGGARDKATMWSNSANAGVVRTCNLDAVSVRSDAWLNSYSMISRRPFVLYRSTFFTSHLPFSQSSPVKVSARSSFRTGLVMLCCATCMDLRKPLYVSLMRLQKLEGRSGAVRAPCIHVPPIADRVRFIYYNADNSSVKRGGAWHAVTPACSLLQSRGRRSIWILTSALCNSTAAPASPRSMPLSISQVCRLQHQHPQPSQHQPPP